MTHTQQPRTFATFGEAFQAAMVEFAAEFVNPFYPCDLCGTQTETGALVKGRASHLHFCGEGCRATFETELVSIWEARSVGSSCAC